MNSLYKQLDSFIDLIDFEELYPGFHRFPFALYDSKKIFFKDHDEEWNEHFIGNTVVEWKGQRLAIWNLEYAIQDLPVFTSKIIHEMFHAYQMEQHEQRFPNEMKGLEYEYVEENMRYKMKETRLLLEAYGAQSRDFFQSALEIRKWRRSKFPDSVAYEAGIEVVEGTAVYVEWKALKQLKRSLPINRYDPLSNPKYYLPIRSVSYLIGALFLELSDYLNVPLSKSIQYNSKTYDLEWIESFHILESKTILPKIDSSFLNDYFETIKIEKETILKQANCFMVCEKIIGFDPMNTNLFENALIAKHFLRVQTGENVRNIFGPSVATLDGTKAITVSYIDPASSIET
ncbi:MAG: hypothetical protein JXB08_06465 [Bacilli bacterium]|nr:hypothetical protein [Bacilli bacterium]MBN2876502.1 hypothetical protein [Bacilli bacterium]